MRSELQNLEITTGELKHLSGLGMNQVYRPATGRKFAQEGFKTSITLILILISYGILAAVFERHHPLLMIIHAIAAAGVIFDDLYKIGVTVKNSDLVKIFDEVERYNAIVRTLILYDDLERAGNSNVKIDRQEQILTALNWIRADLIRALKTERILRKNRRFIAKHQELLETDFNTLIAPFDADETTEPGRLLRESLQLARDVHQQLQQLQDKQSTR